MDGPIQDSPESGDAQSLSEESDGTESDDGADKVPAYATLLQSLKAIQPSNEPSRKRRKIAREDQKNGTAEDVLDDIATQEKIDDTGLENELNEDEDNNAVEEPLGEDNHIGKDEGEEEDEDEDGIYM